MQIIKYELVKKDKYNVYLSNGEVITLDERVITGNKLLLKKEIDCDLYDKINFDNGIYELIDICIKYISIRLRSIKEIEDYLYKRNVNNKDIDIVVSKLIKSGYLDDERFAKAYVKDKFQFTNKGDYKIRMELQQLGVSLDIINSNDMLFDDELIDNRIRKVIDKEIKINKKYNGVILRNRIYNRLLSQGYSKEKVISIINEYDF
ncbi:MAG: RecX family transcriptional regulator [Bacilli bacterium]|nr:RecX family transcriptional regulator [Bacilli bacterium]